MFSIIDCTNGANHTNEICLVKKPTEDVDSGSDVSDNDTDSIELKIRSGSINISHFPTASVLLSLVFTYLQEGNMND